MNADGRGDARGRLQCEAIARAGLGEPAKREGTELLYRCPHPEGHKNGDSHPSLKINPKKNVWACFPCDAKGTAWQLAAFLAGVDAGDKAAVKAWLKDKGLLNGAKRKMKADGRGPCVATYIYTDAQGNLVARKLRFEPGANGEPKEFSWERWEGGKWVSGLGKPKIATPLYRIAKLINEPSVVLTEGEKDADAGASIELPTATSGGTGSWREDHAELLRGKSVAIVADADEPGRVDAQKRAASLYGKAASVKVCEIPGSKDLAEAIEKGMTREALLTLFEQTPEWRPATGAEILDAVVSFVRRFVSLTESQTRTVALWLAHTHALDAADCTPYLAINSPEKQSGKTRLLEVLRLLVARPWLTGRLSAAVLIRKIHAESPTLLLDESDAAFAAEKEYGEALRGVLNTGYRRSGAASCCVGQGAKIDYKDFSTFCAKAIAGIGRLPDTVADRSIPIRVKRARRGEVSKFRAREVEPEAAELNARLQNWCAANLEILRAARPDIPPQLSDRQADVCEPLLAIADLAGGNWPEASRRAVIELCTQAQANDDSVGVKLLADIKRMFSPPDDDGEPLPEIDRIASCDLAKGLGEMEDRPWAEWGKSGRPITQPQLARLLSRYDIAPKTIRLHDGRRLKGYGREQFAESWGLYLALDSPLSPATTDSKRDNVTSQCSCGSEPLFQSVTATPCHASEKAVSANKDASCHGVTVQNGGGGETRMMEFDL
jgi:hypothetical protein